MWGSPINSGAELVGCLLGKRAVDQHQFVMTVFGAAVRILGE